jgi:hypothetical protein
MVRSYGKPILSCAVVAEALFWLTEAARKTVDSFTGSRLTEAAHKIVDTIQLRLAEAASTLFRSYICLSRPHEYVL